MSSDAGQARPWHAAANTYLAQNLEPDVEVVPHDVGLAFIAGYQEGERAGAAAERERLRIKDAAEMLEEAAAQVRADIERQLRDAAAWWDASPALHGSLIGSELAKVADQLAAEAGRPT